MLPLFRSFFGDIWANMLRKGTITAITDIHHSHSRMPHNSKSTWILWNWPCVRAQSHATKHYLALEQLQMTRVERKGPVLFCAACSCCSQSQLGHQPALTSNKMVDCTELFDSKMARQIDLYKEPEIFKNIYLHALPSKTSHTDTFHEIWSFTHLYRAFIFLSNDTKIMQICPQAQKLLINQSGYCREFHSD